MRRVEERRREDSIGRGGWESEEMGMTG
uniref:Uncharacterized protein n=1 Tax=Arundo donax TaxID=35708 RepID=A0A0A9EZB9_ARUDO